MLKKTLSLIAALGLVASLAACSDSDKKPTPDKGSGAKEAGTPDQKVGGETAPPDTGGSDAVTPQPIDVNAGIAGNQIDRAGRPGISSVLLFGATDAQKDEFNQKSPHELLTGTVADYENRLIDTLTSLGTTPLKVNNVDVTAAVLKAVLVAGGDVLKVDTAGTASGYLGVEVGIAGAFGGRNLDDDVVNTSLTALTYQAITTDKVDANDVAFKTTFPYLADAH